MDLTVDQAFDELDYVLNNDQWQLFVDGHRVTQVPTYLMLKVTSTSVLVNSYTSGDCLKQYCEGHELRAVRQHAVITAPIESVTILPQIEITKNEPSWLTLRIGSHPKIEYVRFQHSNYDDWEVDTSDMISNTTIDINDVDYQNGTTIYSGNFKTEINEGCFAALTNNLDQEIRKCVNKLLFSTARSDQDD